MGGIGCVAVNVGGGTVMVDVSEGGINVGVGVLGVVQAIISDALAIRRTAA